MYDFINHMQEVLTQGGTRLILNHKAFKNLVQRYPERSLLSEYTNDELMYMVQKYRASELQYLGINKQDSEQNMTNLIISNNEENN
jgi:hypothetical protein